MNAALAVVKVISPEEARALLEAPEWHFVDVREPDEVAQGRLPSPS